MFDGGVTSEGAVADMHYAYRGKGSAHSLAHVLVDSGMRPTHLHPEGANIENNTPASWSSWCISTNEDPES